MQSITLDEVIEDLALRAMHGKQIAASENPTQALAEVVRNAPDVGRAMRDRADRFLDQQVGAIGKVLQDGTTGTEPLTGPLRLTGSFSAR